MKRFAKAKIASCLLVMSLTALTSCGGSGIQPEKRVQDAVKEAMTLSRDELMKKAAEEIGGNQMKFVGTSSRFKKAIASFRTELTKYNKACEGMSITEESMVDGQVYEKINGELSAGVKDGYSGFLVQDGYQLQKKGLDYGHYVNYIPKEWADANDTNKDLNSNPFALQYNMKTWMINNSKGGLKIDNVWDFASKSFANKIVTMDPNNENVNMDFLIMLTKDKWCDVLKEAYEDPSNDAKSEVDVESYSKYGAKKKYAYAFIEAFLKNSSKFGDDGKARDQMAPKSAHGTAGWIVYSKIASIQETNEVSKKNFTICALGDENNDGNTAKMQMKGFGGFMYKHYLLVSPYAPYPYTACAFINYLSTTAAGYKAWATDIGDYPTMPSINIDRTKYGHGELVTDDQGAIKFKQDNSKENVFPALNDPKSSWWESETGGNVVIEEPAYIAANYAEVKDFIDKI